MSSSSAFRGHARLKWVLGLGLVLAAGILGAWVTAGPEWQAAMASLPELERRASAPTTPEPVQYYLGRRLLEASRPSESYAVFSEAAAAHPRSLRVKVGVLEALAAAGRWDDVEARFAGWPELRTWPTGAALEARMLLDGRKRPEQACQVLEAALKRAPGDAELHYQLGRAYSARYQAREAFDHFKQAARRAPRQPLYRRELGQAYIYYGKQPEAVAELRAALEMDPSDAATLYLLGSVLAQGAGNAAEKDEARQLLMEARELRPDDAEIHCQLGQLAQGAGEYKEAAVLFEHSLELYPAHWDAVYRLAQCRFRLGEDDEGERLMAAYKRMRIALQSETKKFATGEDVLTAQRWRQLSGIFRQSRLTKLAQLTDRRAAAEVAPVASAGDGAPR